MKIIYTLLPLLFFISCATTSLNITETTIDNCQAVPIYWYGEKGVSPADNNVWKCYNWEIQKR